MEDGEMADLVADVVLARLREWGVKQVFGYPSDGINGLLAAWVGRRMIRSSCRPTTRWPYDAVSPNGPSPHTGRSMFVDDIGDT